MCQNGAESTASRPYPDAVSLCDRGALHDVLYLPEWMPKAEHAARQLRATTAGTRRAHHALYVVLLKDTRRVGRWGLYVGETAHDPDSPLRSARNRLQRRAGT
jgi:hypothetical protein